MHFPKCHTLGCEYSPQEGTVQNQDDNPCVTQRAGQGQGSSPSQTGNKTFHFKSLKKISKFNGWS